MAIKATTGAVDSSAAPWTFSEDPDVRGTIRPLSPQVQARALDDMRASVSEGAVEMRIGEMRGSGPVTLHEIIDEIEGVQVEDDKGRTVVLTSSLEHCRLLVRAKVAGEKYGDTDNPVTGERIAAEIVKFGQDLYKERTAEKEAVEGKS